MVAVRAKVESPEIFIAHPRLISVDGPDGVGKGTFCGVLKSMLEKALGEERVVLTSGTRFEATPDSQRLGQVVRRVADNAVARNRLFLLSTRQIFRRIVIPALEVNQVVILDSSTLRHLAFTLATHGSDSPVFTDTRNLVTSGILDFHLFPGTRIILWAPKESLMENLEGRGFTDIGDPTDIEQVQKRIEAYAEAVQIIKGLESRGGTRWIKVENPPLPSDQVKERLSEIIKEDVLPQLPFLGS
jgi:thymidylate kinase